MKTPSSVPKRKYRFDAHQLGDRGDSRVRHRLVEGDVQVFQREDIARMCSKSSSAKATTDAAMMAAAAADLAA